MSELRDCIAQVDAEAAGVINVRLVHASDGPILLLAAMAGDADAASLVTPFASAMERIKQAPRRKPALCASCPAPLRGRNFTIGLAIPSCDSPTAALGFGICTACADDLPGLQRKAVTGLKRIWPNVRAVVIHRGGVA